MEYITETEKTLPLRKGVKTVVAGGGVAGISAALAAARNGADVLLVESQYILGGLATAGLVTIYLPLCDGLGKQVSFGIAEELLRLSMLHGHEGRYPKPWIENGSAYERCQTRFEVQYNPYIFAIKAEQLLLENNVKILYGSSVCGTINSDNKITHLILETPSGREAVAVKNVVDATGDADVCKLCGESTAVFSQGNIPASWYYFLENGENKLKMLGFSDIPDSQKTKEQLENAKNSIRFTGLDADELSALTIRSHSTLLNDFLNRNKINSPTRSLTSIATVPQIRMTRRINGVYTQHDTEQHKEFSDSVGMFSDWRKAGPVYELPFSTLYGKNISNLITAGRCISVTDAMWDITRVIPVCAVSGEAAGTACALTDNFADLRIEILQNRLISNGVVLHESNI